MIFEDLLKLFQQQQQDPRFAGGGTAASSFYGPGDTSNLAQTLTAPPSQIPMNAPGLGEGFGKPLPQLSSYQIGSMVGDGMTPSFTGMDGAPSALQGVGEAQSPFSAFIGKGSHILEKMAPAFAQYQAMNRPPPVQKLERPPSYGQYPHDNATSILERNGLLSPDALKRAKQLGLLGQGM